MYRSTKGASKARRDQINAEIRNLKDLLPISEADKARLSYLHIMSLACMYTRKSVFFTQGKGLNNQRNRNDLLMMLQNPVESTGVSVATTEKSGHGAVCRDVMDEKDSFMSF